MGYAHYFIYRNGERLEAGYAVETVCEKDGCTEQIDRGLGFLCGKTPGGDEHGCGGYFCGQHLSVDQQCEACSERSAASCDDCDGTVQAVSIGLGCACRINQNVAPSRCTCGTKAGERDDD